MSPKNAIKIINIQNSYSIHTGFIWSTLSTKIIFTFIYIYIYIYIYLQLKDLKIRPNGQIRTKVDIRTE